MVSAKEPTDSALRAFESGTHPSKSSLLRSWTTGGGGGAMTFGFLFIQGKALWILKVNERFSRLQENGPLRTAEKSWETLPFGLTLLGSAGMLQKLGMRGREGTRGLQKFRGQVECAGVVAGGPASARARRLGQPRRLSSGRRARGHLALATRYPERGTLAGKSPVTRLRIIPITTYPVFLAPGGDCKPLFIPSYRIHGGFSRGECLNVPPTLHPKGLPTQKGVQL